MQSYSPKKQKEDVSLSDVDDQKTQALMINLFKLLGFGDFSGLCFGFTAAFTYYIAIGRPNKFKKIVRFICDTPDIAERVKQYSRTNQSSDEKREASFLLSAEEQLLKDTWECLKIIKVYQELAYSRFSAKKPDFNILKHLEKLEIVYVDERILTAAEWCFYLEDLSGVLQSEQTEKNPLVIRLDLHSNKKKSEYVYEDHTIGLYYNTKQNAWNLADINLLPNDQPMMASKLNEKFFDRLNLDKCDLEKNLPIFIKNGSVPLFIKSIHFKETDYISANIYVFTREKNPNLDKIKLNFDKFKQSQYQLDSGSRLTKKGETLAHLAATTNDIEKIKKLLESKCDLNVKNIQDRTPMHIAAYYNSVDVMQFLIDIDKSHIDEVDNSGESAAYIAAQTDSLETLVLLRKNGANLKTTNNAGNSLIHVAALLNSMKTMRFLLESKCSIDVNGPTLNGLTAAGLAAQNNNIEILKLLILHGANLHYQQNEQDYAPIHLAAGHDSVDVINFFIQKGVNPDQTYLHGMTAMHIASSHNGVNAIVALVEAKADLNKPSVVGITPLHLATAHGNIDTVKTLLKLKANVLAEEMLGNSPLYYALTKKKWEIAILLLMNVSFDQLNQSDKELISNHGKIILKKLEKIINITIRGNVDKIKKLHLDISMYLFQHKKEKLSSKYTAMAILTQGLFKDRQELDSSTVMTLDLSGVKLAL